MGQKDSLMPTKTILMFDLAPETDDDRDDPLIDVPRDRRNTRHYAAISVEIACDPLLKIVHASKTRYEKFFPISMFLTCPTFACSLRMFLSK